METQEVKITGEEARQLRDECKKTVELAESMTKLESNRDFKKVFIETYSKEEPIRLVKLMADSSIYLNDKKELIEENINKSLIGIAKFNEFIRTLYARADMAKKTLYDLDSSGV